MILVYKIHIISLQLFYKLDSVLILNNKIYFDLNF